MSPRSNILDGFEKVLIVAIWFVEVIRNYLASHVRSRLVQIDDDHLAADVLLT